MISKAVLDNSIKEIKIMITRMEEVSDTAPAGSLSYKRTASGIAVPYLSTGSRSNRRVTRMDPEDIRMLEVMERKTFARKVLPALRKALKALECAHSYEPVNLYLTAAEMGPQFRRCADFFLGRPLRPRSNPSFDTLQERQNIFDFGKNAVTTEDGIFRSKSESLEAAAMKSEGIEFKYEVTLQIGTRWINVDFVVNLYWKKQIGIIEHHGLLEDPKYRRKKMENLETMMNHGIYLGQNLLVLSESPEYGFDFAQTKKLIMAFCLP